MTFKLTDEDGLQFDESPDLFVLLDRNPIIWTVRGRRFFKPRFEAIGISLASIQSQEAFCAAHDRWLDVERSLLLRRLELKAGRPDEFPEYAVLNAILSGEAEA